MVPAGLCAEISTQDQQTLPMQDRTMREYVARRGWAITMQVKEVGSGASQQQLREMLIEAVRGREIDVVLVWRRDRWGKIGHRSSGDSHRTGWEIVDARQRR